VKNILPKPNKKHVLTATTALLIALTYVFTQGFTVSQAQGTCYTETKTCKGLPVNGSCIGSVDEEIDFSSSCGQISEIESSCNAVRENLCASESYNGSEWKEAIVEDFSCGRWEEEYSSVDLKSCNPQ